MKGYRKSLSNASGLDDLGKFLLVSFFFVGCKNITERQTCHGKYKSVGVANTSIKHDLARSCFKFWLKIGDEGDKILKKNWRGASKDRKCCNTEYFL